MRLTVAAQETLYPQAALVPHWQAVPKQPGQDEFDHWNQERLQRLRQEQSVQRIPRGRDAQSSGLLACHGHAVAAQGASMKQRGWATPSTFPPVAEKLAT
eukprot:3894690-Pleurochrysis_carterae.AAC.2